VGDVRLLILALSVAVVGLSALAHTLSIPYPVVLVVGCAALGFVPGVPPVVIDPDIVLLIFLPPLLYRAALFANFGDFRATVRVLTLNTILLVLVTAVAVAAVAHALIPDMSWEASFVLGAIVSPTDPVAAGAVMRRLNAPRQLLSAIEGEGLFNDATALVAYRLAVAAAVSGGFSLAHAGFKFVVGAVGGVAVGLFVGWLVGEVRRRIVDPQLSIAISLLTGYLAFVPADAIGVSGVLATVTAGIYIGVRAPRILGLRSRLQGYYVWEVVDFIINATLFALVGLQLRTVMEALSGFSAGQLVWYGLAASFTVVGARFVWFFTMPYVIRVLDRRAVQRARRRGARWRVVGAWSGMRGAVSLALALAIPLVSDAGDPFPQRDLIIYLTFAVIFFTLVVQGLTLPALIRRLEMDQDHTDDEEEAHARLLALKAALTQLDELAAEEWIPAETLERTRTIYHERKALFAERAGKISPHGYEDRSAANQQLLRLLMETQRELILRLRNNGELSNEAMNRIMRELDLEESRLEEQLPQVMVDLCKNVRSGRRTSSCRKLGWAERGWGTTLQTVLRFPTLVT